MIDLEIQFDDSFFDEEIRCGYTITQEMKKIWAIELDMAYKLIKVCEKHGLKIYADAGTLLGAVRHKGFIPWDDDIDLIMFRNDYDKLLSIAGDEFKYPYFFQTAYSDVEYPRGHAQLRNSETTGILRSEFDKKLKFNQGIFIDIFVLDDVIPNKKKQAKLKKNVYRCKKLIWYILYNEPLPTFLQQLVYKTAAKLVKYDHKKPYKIMEDLFRANAVADAEYVAPLSFNFDKSLIIRKSIYKKIIWLDFENIKLPCPAGYDEFLRSRYGDYMTPAKAPTMHGGVIFDTERPYTEYI